MIKKENWYRIVCDGCGNDLEFDCEYTPLFPDMGEAKDTIKEYDWKMQGKKVYCPDCEPPKNIKP